MNAHQPKGRLRALAAVALVVWVLAQVACFLHCHYPGNRLSAAHSSKVAPEKKCCSARDASTSSDTAPRANAVCVAFKSVTLNDNSPALTPPDVSLLASPFVVMVELRDESPEEFLLPFPSASLGPPHLWLIKPTLLSLPPPVLS